MVTRNRRGYTDPTGMAPDAFPSPAVRERQLRQAAINADRARARAQAQATAARVAEL